MIVETVPTTERLPVEKIAPIIGVIKVVPQVGHPAPRAINPVTIPARSRLTEFWAFFLCQSKTMRPMRIPCRIAIQKTGSHSAKGWLMPKMLTKLSPRMRILPANPVRRISSNFASPPASRFINNPKKIKLGMKPYQKRFSRVARRIPLPAKAKPSNHFLQFM